MAKQTMGKDDNGVFHPGKGKPSGVNKDKADLEFRQPHRRKWMNISK